jgi:hypothetical protein
MINTLLLTNFASATCTKSSGTITSSTFLKFPTWYEYLPSVNGSPCITNINDVWLIAAAVIEILIRIAAFLAVAFVIYGGIRYVTSQGDSNSTSQAQSTVMAAVIGLVICMVATLVITFIAGSIK